MEEKDENEYKLLWLIKISKLNYVYENLNE